MTQQSRVELYRFGFCFVLFLSLFSSQNFSYVWSCLCAGFGFLIFHGPENSFDGTIVNNVPRKNSKVVTASLPV